MRHSRDGVTGVFRDLLPDAIAVSESASPVGLDTLLPAERPFVEQSVEKRRLDFATGRHRARAALATLGLEAASCAIGVGEHRQPMWPAGVIGSITHCEGRYAAAVARYGEFVALGIDVEQNVELTDDVVRATSHARESAALPAVAGLSWPTVLFSAREAVFKAWYPRVGTWLDFLDVTIELDPASGAFGVQFLGAQERRARLAGLLGLNGNVRWNPSHIYTGVWLEA